MSAADRPSVTDDARAEAARRWGDRRTSDRLPMDWLDEGMASGFVLGAQWAVARAETTTDDATQRLARAAYAVDSKHHFHEGQDGRPACSCGFVGDARKRTQTEHITAAVLEEYDHD